MVRPAVRNYSATACRSLFQAMEAISNSGARAVFSRGNPGVVDCTTTVMCG